MKILTYHRLDGCRADRIRSARCPSRGGQALRYISERAVKINDRRGKKEKRMTYDFLPSPTYPLIDLKELTIIAIERRWLQIVADEDAMAMLWERVSDKKHER